MVALPDMIRATTFHRTGSFMPLASAEMTAAEITAAYSQAMKLQSAGQLEQALLLLGRIVEANPNIPEVHYQVGRIFVAADRYDRALTHFQAAARLKPKEPSIWAAWAGAVALAGDAAIEKAYLTALKTAPVPADLRIVLQNRFGAQRAASKPGLAGLDRKTAEALLALMSAQRFAEAEERAAALLRLHPRAAFVANVLASARAAQGKSALAVAGFREAARMDPFYAEAYCNLGQLFLDLNRADEARLAFREAVACAPGMERALIALATLHTRGGQAIKAVPLLERVLKARPDTIAALTAMGNAQIRLQNYAAAETALIRANRLLHHKVPEFLALLAQAQTRLGKDTEAMANYDAALAIAPATPAAQGGKAALLQTLGDFKAAEIWFRRVFETDPNNGENYRLFIASHKTRAGDPIIAQMEARLEDPMLSDTDRMNLGFALAKALEDIKDYPRVFPRLNTANALMRKLYPYDGAQRAREIAAVRDAMSGFDWHGAQIPDTSDFAPIFVTGMPRSGTTLIEQIIASHSLVEGAGEVGDGTRVAQRLMFEGPDGVQSMASLAPSAIAGLGHEYATMMRARFGDASHVTDKSIQTYLFLGLMKLALPKARFVVVRRDPRDTLLSIYKNKFPDGTHLYGYDQRDLAKYYTSFVQMIDFWRAMVPDWFYEVQYEALVADPEAESRAS